MSGPEQKRARRRLALRRETVRALSAADLGRVAGGSWGGDFTAECESDTDNCMTFGCDVLSTGSRFC